MAGSAGTEDYNAAGNSDFSRKAMALAGQTIETWAAPRTSDTNGAGQHGDGGLDLRTQASIWESPSVAVTEGSRLTRSGDRSNELLLTGQAMTTSQQWSAPKASDGEKGGPNQRGSKGDVPLPGQAVNWPGPRVSVAKGNGKAERAKDGANCRLEDTAAAFHPPLSPAPAIAGGAMSSTASPNSNQPSVRRKLNPIFVEALMRWPTGLSGFERPAMGLIQWQPLMHSYLLELCSGFGESNQQMLLFGD